MAKKIRWVRITDLDYEAKEGDALTLNGFYPGLLPKDGRVCHGGFIIYGFAGSSAEYIINDYDEDQYPEVWTPEEYNDDTPTRLAGSSKYSEPLPLP